MLDRNTTHLHFAISTMPGGRPRKKPRVITGLRNQPPKSFLASSPATNPTDMSRAPSPSLSSVDSDTEPDSSLNTAFDSLKIDYSQEDSDSEDSELSNWGDLDDDAFRLIYTEFGHPTLQKDWRPQQLMGK